MLNLIQNDTIALFDFENLENLLMNMSNCTHVCITELLVERFCCPFEFIGVVY